MWANSISWNSNLLFQVGRWLPWKCLFFKKILLPNTLNWKCSPVITILERKNLLPVFSLGCGLDWILLVLLFHCQSLPPACAHSSWWEERKLNTSSHPPSGCSRTALTCSPEGAGKWWFLIWGKCGEMNVKKQTPSSHCDECFRLTFSPVKSLLCSLPSVLKFWKFLFLLKLLAVSSIWIYCRWLFVSLLVVTAYGNSQTLQTVRSSSHGAEDSIPPGQLER